MLYWQRVGGGGAGELELRAVVWGGGGWGGPAYGREGEGDRGQSLTETGGREGREL